MDPCSFIGIPYKFKGRDRNGIDCLGLVWLYLREKGIFIPDDDGLPMLAEAQSDYQNRVLKALDKVARRVAAPQADDIVVMWLPGGYTHMGVMADNQNMLHVLLDRPSALVPVRRYRNRILAIFRPQRRRGSLFEFMLSVWPHKELHK
ncbi:MAG TPA: C40 family peptidase [Firmicutes bacterium]|nr:C40 family peptidase [Candidatus Fermentithermobacillaceae bacterium]